MSYETITDLPQVLSLYKKAKAEFEYKREESGSGKFCGGYASDVFVDNKTNLEYEFEFDNSDEPYCVSIVNLVAPKTDYSKPAVDADTDSIQERLRKRAAIRLSIATRKSVQENKPDRIAELLIEAADCIDALELNIELREVDEFLKVNLMEHHIKNKDATIEYLKGRLDSSGVGYVKV